MKHLDDMEFVKEFGLSRELTEFSCTDARIYNDYEYNWAIQIYPPIERYDVIYFIVYNNLTPGYYLNYADKCARISMECAEYIHCNDCSKREWILNHDEKIHLCEILTDDIWKKLIYEYEEQLFHFDGIPRKFKLKKPDYMLLPE